MSNIITPSTLSGFMELLPNEQVIFDKMRRVLEETYELFGFYSIDTPVLEKSEILFAKAVGETEKQVYRFTKGDTDLAMRFDLTVPLAKYVAKNYGELTFPFKRYQIGKVYRGERAQRGRFREFYQADIDIIGDGSLGIINDAEIPSIIYTVFTKLGLEDFTIRINNRKILNGLFGMLGVTEHSADILHIIDKLDKIGVEKVTAELCELGISAETVENILELLCNNPTTEEALKKLEGCLGKNEVFDAGYAELSDVIRYIGKFGVPADSYRIDLTIARGLDYYTGTVYETTFNKHPEIGSICSGGRYDNLAEFYTKNKLPGVGISIGLTRLFYILCEREYLNMSKSYPADVLIIPMTDDLSCAVETSASLRENGIRCQIYPEKKKFKHMISYADKLSIPYVIFLGESEIESGTVSIKNMTTGEQQTVTLDEAISMLRSGIEESGKAKCIVF